MKLSAHLDKGIWALADRGLPSLYALALIALSRVLGVDEFGTFYIFQVIFNMLFAFTDNFALQAIVKYGVEPEINLEALITATTSIFLGFLLPVLLVLNLFSGTVSTILGNPKLGALFPLLALYVLCSSPRVVFSKVLQMRFRMKEIFWVDLANFGVGGGLLAVGLLRHQLHHSSDVIWLSIVAASLSSIVAVYFGRKFVRIRFELSRPMFLRIKDFVRYQAATGLVSVLQQNFDSLAVSSFTGPIGAGIYGGAKTVYRVFDIMRDTVTLLVFPATSKYYSRGEHETVRTILEKSIGFLYIVLIPFSTLLFIGTPFLFHLVFGMKFDSSIPIFRILVVGSLALPFQMVFVSTMVGMGRVREMFRLIGIGFAVNAAIALVLLPTIGVAGAAISFILSNCVQAILSYREVTAVIPLQLKKVPRRTVDDARQFLQSLLLARTNGQ